MSIIKNALDKSLDQDRDRESLRNNYSRIRQYQSNAQSGDPELSEGDPDLTSKNMSPKKILLITIMVVLSLAVIGEMIFLLVYFS